VNDNRPRFQIDSHRKSEIIMPDRLTGMQVFVCVAALDGLSAAARVPKQLRLAAFSSAVRSLRQSGL
jgi:hypothetical protein